MITTADLQVLARPDLDEAYAALGQQVTIYAQQEQVTDSSGTPQAPVQYDLDGNPVTPLPTDPTPDTPQGAGKNLGTFPCIAMQMDVTDRAGKPALGADLGVPYWEVYIRWDAPLATPGVLLVVTGGELPEPLHLTPIEDAEDMGTPRLAWHVVGRAPGALRSPA